MPTATLTASDACLFRLAPAARNMRTAQVCPSSWASSTMNFLASLVPPGFFISGASLLQRSTCRTQTTTEVHDPCSVIYTCRWGVVCLKSSAHHPRASSQPTITDPRRAPQMVAGLQPTTHNLSPAIHSPNRYCDPRMVPDELPPLQGFGSRVRSGLLKEMACRHVAHTD